MYANVILADTVAAEHYIAIHVYSRIVVVVAIMLDRPHRLLQHSSWSDIKGSIQFKTLPIYYS